MSYKFILIFLVNLIFLTAAYSQPEKAKFQKDIVTDKYLIRLENNESDFFSGQIFIYDIKSGMEIFKAEEVYTDFISDTTIDLNGDSNNELILDLSTGATMYDYNMFLIFDFSENVTEPAEVHNAYLVTDKDKFPKIVSDVRLSPNYLGAGYSFSLEYINGKLLPETDPEKSSVLRSLDVNDKDYLEQMENYVKETGECSLESQIQIYYEAFITQKIITGMEKNGWNFFDRYYKCIDKIKVKKALKKITDENYRFILNPENYRFKFTKYK